MEGPPTLVMQVNRIEGRQILGRRQPLGITLLWGDPPLARQLNLIRLLLPQARHIGVLYSNDSAFLVQELRQVTPAGELEINAHFWPNTRDPRVLSRLLDQSDVRFGVTRSQWQPQNGGTALQYRLEIMPKFWVPRFFARRLMLSTLREGTLSLFTNVEREARTGHATP